MSLRTLLPFLLLLTAPLAQAQYTLTAEPDHPAWAADGDVQRLAVRLGNCMGWTLRVQDGQDPVQGAAVSVTDGDGRRSLVYTGADGTVLVGTRTCHTADHVADHAFEVTGLFGGGDASSNRVVHEVMWTGAQVHADAPAQATGRIEVPVAVVWTATGERVPVESVTVRYGAASFAVDLSGGEGRFPLDVDGNSTLTVSVPAPQWPKGGQDASIPVRQAGPHVIRQPGATSSPTTSPSTGGSPSSTPSGSSSTSGSASATTSTSPPAGGGGGGGGGGTSPQDPTPAPGIGQAPEPEVPERQAQPKPASIGDTAEGPWTPHPVEEGKGAPALPFPLALAAVLLVAWRRRG